ncbi:hypothetical protein AALP_AA5G227200 [Arabis alpina]|uniref:Uncharacterized protein n=1 Tax=Arabis alpina TaxID=50452 RepID=A0A087GYU4_ARAAL|nr:hypothetical protein AALP_AA5G227200 [Arabis alpina]
MNLNASSGPSRSRRPALERVLSDSLGQPEQRNGSQLFSGNLQDVDIRVEGNLGTRNISSPAHSVDHIPIERRNIQDRLGSPLANGFNPANLSSPSSQNRVPLSLRLGDPAENLRDVSISNVNRERRKVATTRGGSTSRGRGRGRGKKTIPRSPLLAAASKKRNALLTKPPAKKRLCMDSRKMTTRRESRNAATSSSNLPLNEEDNAQEPGPEPSMQLRASSSRNPVDFHNARSSLP